MEKNPYILAAQKRMTDQAAPATDPYAMLDNPFLKLVAGNKAQQAAPAYEPGPTDWQGKEMPNMPNYAQTPKQVPGQFEYQAPNVDQVNKPTGKTVAQPDMRKDPETGKINKAGAIPQPETRSPESGGKTSRYLSPKNYFHSLLPDKKSISQLGGGSQIIGAIFNPGMQGHKNSVFNSPYVTRALDELQASNLNNNQKKSVALEIVSQAPQSAGRILKGIDERSYRDWKVQVSKAGQSKSSAF